MTWLLNRVHCLPMNKKSLFVCASSGFLYTLQSSSPFSYPQIFFPNTVVRVNISNSQSGFLKYISVLCVCNGERSGGKEEKGSGYIGEVAMLNKDAKQAGV